MLESKKSIVISSVMNYDPDKLRFRWYDMTKGFPYVSLVTGLTLLVEDMFSLKNSFCQSSSLIS